MAAEQNLTTAKWTRIGHCYEKMYMNDENEPSRGEGPLKGKGIDPQNWGALDFDPAELDENAQ
jgi:hypothetical protein